MSFHDDSDSNLADYEEGETPAKSFYLQSLQNIPLQNWIKVKHRNENVVEKPKVTRIFTKDDLLYPLDDPWKPECPPDCKCSSENLQNWIEMIKYYKPKPVKPNPDFEKWLPKMVEFDNPIPEELWLDYNYAKQDIRYALLSLNLFILIANGILGYQRQILNFWLFLDLWKSNRRSLGKTQGLSLKRSRSTLRQLSWMLDIFRNVRVLH